MKKDNSLPEFTKEQIRDIYRICELTYDGAPVEFPDDENRKAKKEKQLKIYKIWYPNGKIKGKTDFEQASKYQRNALVSKIMEEARKKKKIYQENKSYYDSIFNQNITYNQNKKSDLEKKLEKTETKKEEKPKYIQRTLF